jgi:hypothetical protein
VPRREGLCLGGLVCASEEGMICAWKEWFVLGKNGLCLGGLIVPGSDGLFDFWGRSHLTCSLIERAPGCCSSCNAPSGSHRYMDTHVRGNTQGFVGSSKL